MMFKWITVRKPTSIVTFLYVFILRAHNITIPCRSFQMKKLPLLQRPRGQEIHFYYSAATWHAVLVIAVTPFFGAGPRRWICIKRVAENWALLAPCLAQDQYVNEDEQHAFDCLTNTQTQTIASIFKCSILQYPSTVQTQHIATPSQSADLTFNQPCPATGWSSRVKTLQIPSHASPPPRRGSASPSSIFLGKWWQMLWLWHWYTSPLPPIGTTTNRLVWTNSFFRNALGPGIFQGLDKVLPHIRWRHSSTKFGAKCLLCIQVLYHLCCTIALPRRCICTASHYILTCTNCRNWKE